MKNMNYKSRFHSHNYVRESIYKSHTLDKSRFNMVLYSNMRVILLTSVRSFTSTSSRKGDPLGFVALSFATPWPPSLLADPFGCAFILLMGMGASLFFSASLLFPLFAQQPEYVEILRALDNVFGLQETFISYLMNGINILSGNLNNLAPEILTNYYFSLQELVTVTESLYNLLTDFINLPLIDFLDRPLIDRANEIHENLRLAGNNLMRLLRGIEDRLNIPQEERIPAF